MKKDKDIVSLLEKFMAGTTTIDEEDRLAGYFRSNKVPDEWTDYKKMFAYFDEGMPTVKQKKMSLGKYLWNNKYRFATAVAVAASLVPLFLFTMNSNDKAPQQQNILSQGVLQKDTDDIEKDSAKVIAKPQKEMRSKYHQYIMKTPRPLMAEAKVETPGSVMTEETEATDSSAILFAQLQLCKLEVEEAEAELQRRLDMLHNDCVEVNGVALYLDKSDENIEEQESETGSDEHLAY
nr:hypothetical protein [Prevotella sp.]